MTFEETFQKYWCENDPDMPSSAMDTFRWFYEQGEHTAEQRVARECCEIMREEYKEPHKGFMRIKAKYGLTND